MHININEVYMRGDVLRDVNNIKYWLIYTGYIESVFLLFFQSVFPAQYFLVFIYLKETLDISSINRNIYILFGVTKLHLTKLGRA